ncbi:MFS transporter [Prolixibacter denitrificans]|uniref:MFS transporter n=1 Tax=Prolixibacter denitrificans TaxID=1541063 RepID=A0A2P8CJW3_9BACT|nr:MFS transporter [Prolixibacter denitrificans]PSK85235.1 putative MFS family arabinose efflux permease [Prolixibacter denitrificans]GET19857.1 MFS transporter [Prolixibacter denitrificans]
MVKEPQQVPLLKNPNLHIIFSITLIAVMGVASITPAFPDVMHYFKITPVEVGYLITAFTLPGVLLTPIAGILGDRLGRKNILIPSLLLFGAAGLACMFTRSFHILLVFRLLQGIGAASLGSLNITLIGDLFSGQRRAAAMGYNASVLSIGTASYPAVGGMLAMYGWQYPFILPILAVPVAIWALTRLNNPEPDKQPDLKTYLKRAWNNINQRDVWGLFVINILIFVILYGAYLSYFPLLLENRLRANSLQIGLMMSGFSVVTAITSSQLKNINRWLKPRTQLIFSFSFYLVTMVVMSFASSWFVLFIPLITFGLGHGMAIPGIQNLLVGFAPMKERAAFMSINSMVLRLGQTIGPVFIGFFYGLGGISTAFIAGAGVALTMILLAVFFIRLKTDTNATT